MAEKAKGLEKNIGKVVEVIAPNLWVAESRRGDKAFMAHSGDKFLITGVTNIKINKFYEIIHNRVTYYVTANKKHTKIIEKASQ